MIRVKEKYTRSSLPSGEEYEDGRVSRSASADFAGLGLGAYSDRVVYHRKS